MSSVFRFGPATLVTAAFIGPGTVVTASLAGANFGYALLWALLFSVLATLILQEMAARLGIVTGRGLGENLRQQLQHPLQHRLQAIAQPGQTRPGLDRRQRRPRPRVQGREDVGPHGPRAGHHVEPGSG